MRWRFDSVDAALLCFPQLATRLKDVDHGSREKGSLTEGHVYDRVTDGQTALVGDASGSVDSITGDGLMLSFLQADALGHALGQNDLTLYERAHRTIRRVPTFISQSMLLMDRFSTARRLSFSLFRRSPGAFERMLAVHVGAIPLPSWVDYIYPRLAFNR